jgi:hypothetical protein
MQCDYGTRARRFLRCSICVLCATESDYNHYVLFSRVLDTVVCAYTLAEQEGCIITRMMHDNKMEFSSQRVNDLILIFFLAY